MSETAATEAPSTDATPGANSKHTKYRSLSANFFRGRTRGQINSVFKSREKDPDKVAEYRAALESGDVTLGDVLTKQQANKLIEMNIAIPEVVQIRSPRATKAKPEQGGDAQEAAAA